MEDNVFGARKASAKAVGLVAVVAAAAAAVAGPTVTAAASPAVGRELACAQISTMSLYVPPPMPTNFNPDTATRAQLDAYGIPPRPQDPGMLAAWEHFVKSPIDFGTSCGVVPNMGPQTHTSAPIELAAAADAQSPYQTVTGGTWGGWAVHNGSYTDAEGSMYVPSVTADGTNTDEAGHWVGLNLGQTQPIVQAGVATNWVNGAASYRPWYEFYVPNCDPASQPTVCPQVFLDKGTSPVYVSAGDSVYVHVYFSAGHASFHIVNYSKGWDRTYPFSGSGTSDGHAEWITERGGLPNATRLTKFSSISFAGAEFANSGGWQSANSVPANSYNYVGGACGVQTHHPSSWYTTQEMTIYFDSVGGC